jgi:hypothetical protein
MPRAVVHIGTQKTGTTTFQTWATHNREALHRTTGLRYYRSVFGDFNEIYPPIEFLIECLRPERVRTFRDAFSEQMVAELPERLRVHLLSELDGGDVLISNEVLSLMRHPDEVDSLCQLLSGYDIEFIAVRREPREFLRSYRQWMVNQRIAPSTDPTSEYYVEDDTWLLDFDALDPLFPGLRWVDYDEAMATYGSIIPALCEEMGLDLASVPNWRIPARNRAGGIRTSIARQRRRIRAQTQRIRHRVRRLRGQL